MRGAGHEFGRVGNWRADLAGSRIFGIGHEAETFEPVCV